MSRVTDNETIRELMKDVHESFERGFWEGLESKSQQLPSFYNKTLINLKPYEMGYYYGALTKRIEEDYSIKYQG